MERFKNGECTANNLTIESCTQCDYNCFMLGGCNFNDFNTGNVTDMNHMFFQCFFLRELDLSKFNTKKVTNMKRM